MEAWKQYYKPILIGKRLLILPAWMESPEPDRTVIKIEPGMAFGSGTHPTTQLCLELIEKVCDTHPISHMIDVGCGSGILSIAAVKLGAEKVLGVDIEEESIAKSRENANINGIGDEFILSLGSVQEIIDGQFEFKKAPLVVANILASVLIRLLGARLADLIEDDGALILSGILQEQEQSVVEAGQAHGLRMIEQRQIGDWVALTMSR